LSGLIEADNLTKWFPVRKAFLSSLFGGKEKHLRAVDGVNFDVARREVFGLVGESGCGKSVTALSIMRLIPHPPGRIVAGQVILNGRDLLKLDSEEMRRIRGKEIAMVFQEPMTCLNPVLTIGRQLTETMEAHLSLNRTEARKRAGEVLKRVGIPSPERRLSQYPHQFSGGMRQRTVIATALVLNPDIVIADEPTTALDLTIQGQILWLLENIQKRSQMAMIYITHNLAVASSISHRIAVMYLGKIVELAFSKELFGNLKHPYTEALMSAVPIPDPDYRVKRILLEGDVPSPINPPSGCRFHTRCRYALSICHKEEPFFSSRGGGSGLYEHSSGCGPGFFFENL
jgi:oligopeptide/dipeptide ABC transporter ATP-binding protein